jgi:Kef-type K+ transport system membrane component KefB
LISDDATRFMSERRRSMFEVICITFAFFFGLAVRQVGLPPLVGFLAAGFAINAFGPGLGLPEEPGISSSTSRIWASCFCCSPLA